jgi:hypothetical protein
MPSNEPLRTGSRPKDQCVVGESGGLAYDSSLADQRLWRDCALCKTQLTTILCPPLFLNRAPMVSVTRRTRKRALVSHFCSLHEEPGTTENNLDIIWTLSVWLTTRSIHTYYSYTRFSASPIAICQHELRSQAQFQCATRLEVTRNRSKHE